MKEAPRLIVTGLGRSGTSMAMQMLAAAGVPVTGKAPAYEVEAGLDPAVMASADFPPGAVKIIDLPRLSNRLPRGRSYQWIVTDRRMKREQAKSQIKFMAMFAELRVSTSKLDRLVASLANDAIATIHVLTERREPFLRLWFKDVLANPAIEAARLRGFLLGCGHDVGDTGEQAAASVVCPREPKCFKGFLEASMLGADQ